MRHSSFGEFTGESCTARVLAWLAFLMVAAPCPRSQAQWITQTNLLKPGWNSVFFHVDASHATLDQLVGNDLTNPIEEIWSWRSALPTGQFVESPQLPTGAGSQWSTWTRLSGPASSLQRLTGNGAYLVRVGNSVASYSWRVKGRPVAPTYRWTLTGLNFIGFPVPSSPAPSFESLFAPAPELLQNGEVYRYQGGELSVTNPVRVFAFRNATVQRNQAYWVRAGETYNQYFGPIQILQSSSSGIRFGSSRGQAQLRLRNSANVPITVTLQHVVSEAPPAGQPSIVEPPTLLVRGMINTTNLTYGYSILEGELQHWTLAPAGQPGSEVEIVLGLVRSVMSGNAGDQFASILRFTDSLGLSQVDIAVSAEKASTAGLWVGGASISYVSHYLKPYARAANATDFAALLSRLQLAEGADGYHYELDTNTGRVLVFGGTGHKTGSYLLDGPIKIDSGKVARPYPLRLILHSDGASVKLLQKVFFGVGVTSNTVVATREEMLLPSQLSEARRISSVHFPASAGNIFWSFSGALQPGGSVTGIVPLSYDDHASNPFLHTYHPDHDNLDASFSSTLERGIESYGVTRRITLSIESPEDDFGSLTQSSGDLTGNYAEEITFEARGSQTRKYNVLGTFTLKRISDIATLTE